MTSNKKSLRLRAQRFKGYIPLYIMMIPAFTYLFINNYMPMGGMVLAFKKYNVKDGIWGSAWYGLNNFKFLYTNKSVLPILRNTIGYNLLFQVVNQFTAIFLAICITEIANKKLRKIAQSSILFPYVISIIIVSYLVRAFLDPEAGQFNALRRAMGLENILWYYEKKYWPFILVFVNTWKGVGYGCTMYIASILGIDPALYEAAALAGASKWQSIRKITLPFLKPTLITLLLLACGRIFSSDFGLFYQVPQNSGLLQPVTQTVDTFVYRTLLEQANIGMSSAASFMQSVVGFVMVMTFNAITRRISREDALF